MAVTRDSDRGEPGQDAVSVLQRCIVSAAGRNTIHRHSGLHQSKPRAFTAAQSSTRVDRPKRQGAVPVWVLLSPAQAGLLRPRLVLGRTLAATGSPDVRDLPQAANWRSGTKEADCAFG